MARVKRTYKDSLFCDIFRRKDYLQDVYRGLFGRDVSLQEIQLMTLQGTFFNDEKNDVSFLAGKRQIVLMEHQSTLYCTQGCGHAERRDGVKNRQDRVQMKTLSETMNPFSWTDPKAGNCRCV